MQINLRHYCPSKNLSPYIRNYFFFRSSSAGHFKLFPVGNPRLIFYNKGEMRLYIQGTSFPCQHPTLSGQFMQFYELSFSPGTEFMGISFFPAGLYKLLGVHGEMVVNKLAPLSSFINNNEYIDQITQAKTDTHVVSIHETFLQQKMTKEYPLPPVVDLCIADIHTCEGNVFIDQLAEKYNFSRRYLEKHFRYSIGMSPGKYAKRVRFFMVMKKILQEKATRPNILADFNYYDLSHFAKDFEYFMGEKWQSFSNNEHPLLELFIREECLYKLVHQSS